MTSERIDELLALAALGELTDPEERELDALLADDADAAAELDADLGMAATLQQRHAEQPPPQLKEGVLAAIADVEQLPAHTPSVDVTTTDISNVTSFDNTRTRRRSRWQPLAAAAAAILVVAGGLFAASNRAGAPGPIDEIAQAVDATSRTFDGSLDGELHVIYSPTLDAFVLQGTDVPVVTDTETYQLWLVDTVDGVRSVGLFRPDDNGDVSVRFDGFDPSGATVAITIEPAGGSESPTEPIVATA